jgi:actin-like ATPase involved in cell morphogenesis
MRIVVLAIGVLAAVEVDGQKVPRIGIVASTMLSSIPTNVNLFAPSGEGDIEQLIAMQKSFAAELVRQNP